MVNLTKQAADEIKKVVQEQNIPGDAALRIGVTQEGCSGHGTSKSYYLQLEESRLQENDHLFESEGVKILVNADSLPYLAGLQLDFVDTIEKKGFVFFNPNAKGSCGCGHSFSVDDQE
jgi:iron-sulfur cluster assembly protein